MANIDLTKYGITGTTEVVYNPSYEFLFEEETKEITRLVREDDVVWSEDAVVSGGEMGLIDCEREDRAGDLGGDICAVDEHVSSNEGIVWMEGRVDEMERKKFSGWYRQRRYEEESSVSFS